MLLARPIFHTCIKYMKLLEAFNVFVDSSSTPSRFNAADDLLLCLAFTLSYNAISQNMDFVKHFNVLLDLTSIYFTFLDGC